MDDKEREQMVAALGEALCWVHEHKSSEPSVRLLDDGRIVCSWGSDGVVVIENIGVIEDYFGGYWHIELGAGTPDGVIQRLYEGLGLMNLARMRRGTPKKGPHNER